MAQLYRYPVPLNNEAQAAWAVASKGQGMARVRVAVASKGQGLDPLRVAVASKGQGLDPLRVARAENNLRHFLVVDLDIGCLFLLLLHKRLFAPKGLQYVYQHKFW